jgi:hypothetical protein
MALDSLLIPTLAIYATTVVVSKQAKTCTASHGPQKNWYYFVVTVTVVIGWLQTILLCCFCCLFTTLLCLMHSGNEVERMPAPYIEDVMNMVKGDRKKFGEVSAKSKETS